MKMIKIVSLFALSFSFLFTACSDTAVSQDDAVAYISKDASSVTSINLKRLMDKADFEAVKQMAFFQDAKNKLEKNEGSLYAEILENPEKSGVDLSKNAYMSTFMHPKNPEHIFFSTVFSLQDASSFEKMIKTQINEKSTYKQTKLNRDALLAWNDKIAVIGTSNAGSGWLNEKVADVFLSKPENSVAQNKNFQTTNTDDHDFSTWFSTNSFAENPEAGLAMSMLQLEADALKDNYIHGSADFENGAIVSKQQFMFNDEMGKKFIGRFFKEESDTDFSDYLPADNLVFAATGAIDFKGIDQFLSVRPQAKGYIDFMLKEWDLSMKDIMETFGGDVFVTGFGNQAIKDGNGLFATNIKSDEKIKQFLQLAIENNFLMEIDQGCYKVTAIGLPGMSFSQGGKTYGHVLLKDDLLFYSPNESTIASIKDGTYDGGNAKANQLLKNSIFSGFFDMQAVKEMTNELEEIDFENMELKVNGSEANFKMNLKEKDQNSLKTIFEMINEQYKKDEVM